jgi:transposase
MNTKLHAITDTSGRPIRLFITAGQVSDYTGAAALMNGLPEAEWLLADRGYDADWFREALVGKGTKPCIPGRKSRKKTVKYDKRRYKRRNRPSRDIAAQCTAGQRSRECSASSRTGGASQPATTDHQPYSSPQSPSQQPSYSGYEA